MTIHLRQLNEGSSFYLLRTMQRFTFVRRDRSTPSGTRYVVRLDGATKDGSLHHSCHVKPIVRVRGAV